MPANRNPVSAVSENGLELVALLKYALRGLKAELYGPNCNSYRRRARNRKEKLPEGIATEDLERELDKIFSVVGLDFAKEITETRLMVEEGLGRQVGRLMPIWFPPEALVMYSLRIEGRNGREMRGSYSSENSRWGYKQEQTPVAVLPAKEWPSAWRDFVFLDRRVDSEDMKPYMPKGADYLLSTVHKFEVVTKRVGNEKTGHYRNSLDEHFRRADDAESLHWRVKSGPEKLWKMAILMTGLERKPEETIEEIVDDAGIRLLCGDEQLGRKFGGVCLELQRGYPLPNLKGAVILQKLPVENAEYDHLKTFLDSLPVKYRGFCKSVMTEEDRNLRIADESMLPYYIEMLSRFGRKDANVFDRNVIDTLVYGNRTFFAMYGEDGYDEFAYKARSEGWRTDHYTLFEWLVAKRLAQILMTGTSLGYANEVIDARTRQLGLKAK